MNQRSMARTQNHRNIGMMLDQLLPCCYKCVVFFQKTLQLVISQTVVTKGSQSLLYAEENLMQLEQVLRQNHVVFRIKQIPPALWARISQHMSTSPFPATWKFARNHVLVCNMRAMSTTNRMLYKTVLEGTTSSSAIICSKYCTDSPGKTAPKALNNTCFVLVAVRTPRTSKTNRNSWTILYRF